MADSSNITASPFLRAEIVDRVLQLTNPAIPYLTAIHLSSAVPTRVTAAAAASASASISLYQLILRHCRALRIKERKQRYELLTAKLHLLVNASVPPSAPAHAAGAGDSGTNGHEVLMQKAVGELDVLLLTLEIAVLALLQAGGGADADAHANSGPAEAGELVQAPAQQATEQATEGMIGAGGKWKEAESVAGLVNTECGHLIRRLERLSTANATAATPVHERTVNESAQRVTEMVLGNGENRAAEDSSSDDITTRTIVDAARKLQPPSKWSIVPASDISPRRPQEHRHIVTAIHIRLAALEVLVRVDEQSGRDGRVKRWQEQIAKLQEQLNT